MKNGLPPFFVITCSSISKWHPLAKLSAVLMLLLFCSPANATVEKAGWGDDLAIGEMKATVWKDYNSNDIYDFGETALAGVEVALYDARTDNAIAYTRSDEYGRYAFAGVSKGEYYLIFDASEEFEGQFSFRGQQINSNCRTNHFSFLPEQEEAFSMSIGFQPQTKKNQQVLPPVADFSLATPICANANIQILFTGTASPTATLDWDLSGGVTSYSSPATSMSPAATELHVSWATTGNIDIILSVTDGTESDQKIVSLRISGTAPDVTYKAIDVSACGEYKGGIDLNVNSTGSFNYSWTGPNGFNSTDEDVMDLDTGLYEVIVTDLSTTCYQWMRIPIKEDGSTACTDTIQLTLAQGVSLDTCIGWALNLPDQISSAAICQADPARVGASVNNNDDCVTLIPAINFSGNDTICVVHCDNVSVPNSCDTTYFILTVNACSDFITVDEATADNFRCDEAVPVCLSIPYGDMLGYDIYDNGQPYSGGLKSCDFDTTYAYDYSSMPGGGADGPFDLDYWDFNGTVYSGTFTNPQALVNIMNLWDPMGNWTLDSGSQTIRGGVASSSYGSIGYTQQSTMTSGELNRTNLIGNNGTEVRLTGGIHELIMVDPGNLCQDTIIFNPNCIDCPTVYSGPDTVEAASCNGQAEVCLNVPYLEVGSYNIRANGVPVTSIQPGCTPDSTYGYDYSVLASTGPFRLLSWSINGAGMSYTFNTIAELVNEMTMFDPNASWGQHAGQQRIFGGAFGENYSSMIIQNINTWMSDTLDLMVFYDVPKDISVQLDTGAYEIIVENPNGFCIDTINLTVTCAGCVPVISGSQLLTVDDCDSSATYCVDISPADAGMYQFFDNGSVVDPATNGCTMTVGSYQYDLQSIPNIDNPGIFNLNNWSANGSDYTANGLSSIDQLVSSMNSWDPTGNWNRNGTLITGGDPSGNYGSLELSMGPNQQYVISPSSTMVYSDMSLVLDTGYHEIIVINTMTSCRDTALVTVECTPPLICNEILMVDEEFVTLSNCADTAHICIDIPLDSIGNYSFSVGGQPYTMGFEGCSRTATTTQVSFLTGIQQLMITDLASGCQDSLEIMVSCITSSTLNLLVEVGTTDTVCIATDQLTGNLDTMEDICADTSASAVAFNLQTNTYCLEYTGLNDGVDTSCIVICDDMGMCDTTYVVVTASSTPQNNLPVAIADSDTTFQETVLEIAVLANDTFNGAVDTMYILSSPANGTASFNSSGTISYEPSEGYCDMINPDQFTYMICNTLGCDSATVSVYVYCNDVQFYTGFSPNGDGKNDVLYIDGLESLPNNRLVIFNRWGNMVFSADGYQNDWDGRMNGDILPDGTYFFLLDDGEGGQRSGYIQIHR